MIGWLLLAGALGWGVWRVFLGYPRTRQPLRVLGSWEAAFLDAAADALFPAGGRIESSGLEANVPLYVDRLLCASKRRTGVLMRMLFFLVEHATLFFPAPGRGGMRRFSSLTTRQCEAVLEGWGHSRWFPRRLVFTSLRAIVTMAYFSHPPVLRELGFAPPDIETPICEADLLYPRVGRGPESIEWTRDDLSEPSDGTPLPLHGPLDPRYAEAGR